MRTRENLRDEADRIQARLDRPLEPTIERRLAELETRVRLLMQHRIADLEEQILNLDAADIENAARHGFAHPLLFSEPGAPPNVAERKPMTLAEAMRLSAPTPEE